MTRESSESHDPAARGVSKNMHQDLVLQLGAISAIQQTMSTKLIGQELLAGISDQLRATSLISEMAFNAGFKDLVLPSSELRKLALVQESALADMMHEIGLGAGRHLDSVFKDLFDSIGRFADLSEVMGSFAAQNLSIAVGQIDLRLREQSAELGKLTSSLLSARLDQAARSWAISTSPKNLITSLHDPRAVLNLGLSVEAVNTAGYELRSAKQTSKAKKKAKEKWESARQQESESWMDWLEEIDPKLSRKYRGAWDALANRGPDWMSQAANSAVELVDWTLRYLAPEEDVLSWRAEQGLYAGELGTNGKPHRSLKVRYIAHQRSLPASSVGLCISAVTGTLGDLQKLKHADDAALGNSVRAAMLAVECCLLMLWNGGEH